MIRSFSRLILGSRRWRASSLASSRNFLVDLGVTEEAPVAFEMRGETRFLVLRLSPDSPPAAPDLFDGVGAGVGVGVVALCTDFVRSSCRIDCSFRGWGRDDMSLRYSPPSPPSLHLSLPPSLPLSLPPSLYTSVPPFIPPSLLPLSLSPHSPPCPSPASPL